MPDAVIRPGEWLGPWWLERQRDPDSPDFVPGAGSTNVTHRTWTRLGTLSGADRAVVDPRGLVTGAEARWSLDWWVGADDRWHLPSREVAVRQNLIGDAPIVETLMRVPGGDAVQRAFAIAGPNGPLVVVEIENRTAIPFAIAVAVRPYHPLGDGSVGSLAVSDATVLVDGAAAMVLPRPPNRVALATAADGDVVHTVLAGDAGRQPDTEVYCADGRAQGAFIFPLPHTAVLRVAMPVVPVAPRRRGEPVTVRLPDATPSVEQVVKGWQAQSSRAFRVEVPDPRLTAALEVNRRHLLTLAAGEDVAGWPSRPMAWREMAAVTTALDRFGFHDEAESILLALPDRQALDGYVGDGDDGWAANGSALHAVGVHWQLTGDTRFADTLVGPVAKAGHWIERHRNGRRPRRNLSGPTIADLAWSICGLRDSATAMTGAGQPEVAEDLLRFAEVLVAALLDRLRSPSPAGVAPPTATDALAVAALDVLPVGDAWLDARVAEVRARDDHEGALFDHETRLGFDPLATLLLATVERLAGDRAAVDRLNWMLDTASPTATWPSRVHPRTRGGSAGDGHDPAITAAFCSFVRDLLVDDSRDGLALCGVVAPTWHGQGWEVHDAPTAFGRLGYAVRWHGERPALLWQLEPHDAAGPVRITAPGLDPSWSTDQPVGEALFAPLDSRPATEIDPEVDERSRSGEDPGASSSFS